MIQYFLNFYPQEEEKEKISLVELNFHYISKLFYKKGPSVETD